ncbi:MAG: phosphotransferase family protein [Caulobacteraceae bacterium]|nr:phosphotransferase family protein [Caulobacteraceae bacterium]
MTGETVVTDVRPAHRFDPAPLEAWLTGRLPGFTPPLRVRQFEGGHSNPTFLLEAGDRRWVMRKKPPGVLLPSAHQVGREFTVLKALQGSDVPVPAVRLHCEDPSVVGAEFFIMDWVKGRILLDPLLSDQAPAERGVLYEDFIRVLARLHAVDLRAAGLEDYGRPGNYYQRQIGRWIKQYQLSETEDIEDMRRLMDWLPANIPADDQVTLVHGDYSIRNCMVHPTEPRIVAVLDWELSTIGHPYADVAYTTLFQMGDTPQADIAALGIPGQQAMLDRYIAVSGRPPPADWTFYKVFVLFRIAAINQGVYKRGLDGNAASDQFALVLPSVRRHAARAWALVEGAGD